MNDRILILGAGAVGQVYGFGFQRAGATVGFAVRAKRIEETRAGFSLHAMGRGLPSGRLEPDAVIDAADISALADWDTLVITLPSNGLREPSVAALLFAWGERPIVLLSPGIEDHDLVAAHLPEECITVGRISVVAWTSPLPDSEGPEGLAYWFPPRAALEFAGRDAERISDLLRSGGLPARANPELRETGAFPPAILMPFIAVLEEQGWSFRGMSGLARRRFRDAATEALDIVGAHLDRRPPFALRALVRTIGPTLLRTAEMATPFPLEKFLAVHFTKVGEQTTLGLDNYVQMGEERGISAPTLGSILAARRSATTTK